MDEEEKKKDHIANILGVEPISMADENGVVIYQGETEHEKEVDEDIAYVRKMMYEAISDSKDAVSKILDIADKSQSARAYEVAAALLTNFRQANKDLLDLHKTKKELKRENIESNNPTNVQQNLFVGSTAELLQLMKQARKTNGSDE